MDVIKTEKDEEKLDNQTDWIKKEASYSHDQQLPASLPGLNLDRPSLHSSVLILTPNLSWDDTKKAALLMHFENLKKEMGISIQYKIEILYNMPDIVKIRIKIQSKNPSEVYFTKIKILDWLKIEESKSQAKANSRRQGDTSQPEESGVLLDGQVLKSEIVGRNESSKLNSNSSLPSNSVSASSSSPELVTRRYKTNYERWNSAYKKFGGSLEQLMAQLNDLVKDNQVNVTHSQTGKYQILLDLHGNRSEGWFAECEKKLDSFFNSCCDSFINPSDLRWSTKIEWMKQDWSRLCQAGGSGVELMRIFDNVMRPMGVIFERSQNSNNLIPIILKAESTEKLMEAEQELNKICLGFGVAGNPSHIYNEIVFHSKSEPSNLDSHKERNSNRNTREPVAVTSKVVLSLEKCKAWFPNCYSNDELKEAVRIMVEDFGTRMIQYKIVGPTMSVLIKGSQKKFSSVRGHLRKHFEAKGNWELNRLNRQRKKEELQRELEELQKDMELPVQVLRGLKAKEGDGGSFG